ncbi:GSCOCG00011307001-RA-CDS, partial [Cotesia congregata]
QYLSPGPNLLWHFDGYDKLKQFGFALDGCIDGFSRRFMYFSRLEVATTNNNPTVTAYYYLKTIKTLQFFPITPAHKKKSSENVLIRELQISLQEIHTDKLSGKKSFIHGKSVKNQRIESYWGQMRQHTVDFCIQMFKCLQEQNLFDGSA